MSLCLDSSGQWHFTPTKTHDCVSNSGVIEAFTPANETCIDVGFDFDSELVASANPVKAITLLATVDTTFEVKVPAVPVAKYEILFVKNAPPDVVLGELYNNINARLLI